MRRARRGDLVPVAGILCLMLLGLAGCDGGGGEKKDTAPHTSRLTLQISTPAQPPSGSPRHVASSGQMLKVAPTDPDFIAQLDIRIEAADIPSPLTHSLSLTEAQQDEVTAEFLVPIGPNRRIIVDAVNASGTQIFHGEVVVNLTQDVEVVTLILTCVLCPEAVNTSDLTQKAFTFAEVDAFNTTGPVTLTFGPFVGNKGLFTLVSGSFAASGSVTVVTATTSSTQSHTAASGEARQTTPSTCTFSVETSTYPSGQGPQAGEQMPFTPCTRDATSGRLILGDAVSAPPVAAPEFTPPNTVRIASPSGPVASGGTFTVPVGLHAGASRVVSYLFVLAFDPKVVEVVDIEGIEPFDGLITDPATFAKGVVKFAANNTTFTPASGVLFLAVVTFRAVGSLGTTSILGLAFPPEGVLVDDTFQPMQGVSFVNGSVEAR